MANAVTNIEEHRTGTAITPADMIQQALTTGSGPEVMEKLLTLQERWDANQAKKAFDNAMAQLRENLPKIIKRQEVDYTTSKGRTNYRYEDLSGVTEALAPVMAPLGLSFRWRTESGKEGVTVTCIIAHRDGHSEENSLTAGADVSGGKNSIQAIGSAVTYLQRYTLKAAVGAAASYDDDVQSVEQQQAPAPEQKVTPVVDRLSKNDEARALYKRLQTALRKCKTTQEYDSFWQHPKTAEARRAVPADWERELIKEAGELIDRLTSDDDPFPGDIEG